MARDIRDIKRVLRGVTPGGSEQPEEVPDPKRYASKSEFVFQTGTQPPEHVRRYLASRGGHSRQQELIDHTGWSDSVVSRLLQKMERNGEVERVTVGREKLVALPGSLPEDER